MTSYSVGQYVDVKSGDLAHEVVTAAYVRTLDIDTKKCTVFYLIERRIEKDVSLDRLQQTSVFSTTMTLATGRMCTTTISLDAYNNSDSKCACSLAHNCTNVCAIFSPRCSSACYKIPDNNFKSGRAPLLQAPKRWRTKAKRMAT